MRTFNIDDYLLEVGENKNLRTQSEYDVYYYLPEHLERAPKRNAQFKHAKTSDILEEYIEYIKRNGTV